GVEGRACFGSSVLKFSHVDASACSRTLPPLRHQSVLLLAGGVLHCSLRSFRMGSLLLTTCLLSSLVSAGYSITCFVCRAEGEFSCTGEERPCPKDYVCAATSSITIMGMSHT
ncbi:hypothetical protein GDO81_023086, partial [Engystomops pustulosus]